MAYHKILRTLKQKHLKPYNIVGFDVETHGKNNKFYMGGLYDDEGYHEFYNKEEMIEFLITTKKYRKKTYIVATNLMFDFCALFMDSKYWNDFKLILKGSKLILAAKKYKRKDGKSDGSLNFIDTLNYGGFSVKVMGEILKLKKLPTPKCIQNNESPYARIPKDQEEDEELLIYNERDCLITKNFTEMLQKGFNDLGGMMRITSASTSMDIFRRKYLKKWIIKEDLVLKRSDDNSVHDFIFESYYGGRTEAFKRGLITDKQTSEAVECKAYDINSLYPYCMTKSYPDPSSAVYVEKYDPHLLHYEGVSEVTVYCPYMEYPLLPLRKDGKLIFPVGVFRATYTHIELRRAKELGYSIIDIHKTLYYKRECFPFRGFVDDLYAKRMEQKRNHNPVQHVTKLIMNSLYGKTGERKAIDTQIIDYSLLTYEEFCEMRPEGSITEPLYDKYFLVTKEIQVKKAHVIPIFASYTTAKARLQLYNYIQKYRPLYCDTDSCFTTVEMGTSEELGGMKLEYDIKRLIIVKPKMYCIEFMDGKYKTRLKGVTGMNEQKFQAILRGDSVSYQKFTKLKEGLRRGIPVNSIQAIEKLIDLQDNKRRWMKPFSGSTTSYSKPLEVNE